MVTVKGLLPCILSLSKHNVGFMDSPALKPSTREFRWPLKCSQQCLDIAVVKKGIYQTTSTLAVVSVKINKNMNIKRRQKKEKKKGRFRWKVWSFFSSFSLWSERKAVKDDKINRKICMYTYDLWSARLPEVHLAFLAGSSSAQKSRDFADDFSAISVIFTKIY